MRQTGSISFRLVIGLGLLALLFQFTANAPKDTAVETSTDTPVNQQNTVDSAADQDIEVLIKQAFEEASIAEKMSKEIDLTFHSRLNDTQSPDITTGHLADELQLLYLWTENSWDDTESLEEVRAALALLGLPNTKLENVGNSGQFTLEIGPFYTASERNNARLELIKLDIVPKLHPPG